MNTIVAQQFSTLANVAFDDDTDLRPYDKQRAVVRSTYTQPLPFNNKLCDQVVTSTAQQNHDSRIQQRSRWRSIRSHNGENSGRRRGAPQLTTDNDDDIVGVMAERAYLSSMILTMTHHYQWRSMMHNRSGDKHHQHWHHRHPHWQPQPQQQQQQQQVQLRLDPDDLVFIDPNRKVTTGNDGGVLVLFKVAYTQIYAAFRYGQAEQFKIMILPPVSPVSPPPCHSHDKGTNHAAQLLPEDCYITLCCDNISSCTRWIRAITRRITLWTEERPGRALVIINPKSGARGDKMFNKVLYPMFSTMSHYMPHLFSFTHLETKYSNHAFALISEADFIYDYNVIVAVGGDGLVHEIVNALRDRSDATHVYDHVSIAVIPTGTNNSLAMTLNAGRYPIGRTDQIDYHEPSVQYQQFVTLFFSMVLKGRSLPMDILELYQNGQRQYSACTLVVGHYPNIVHFHNRFKRYCSEHDLHSLLDSLKSLSRHDIHCRARIQYVEFDGGEGENGQSHEQQQQNCNGCDTNGSTSSGRSGHQLLDTYFPEYRNEGGSGSSSDGNNGGGEPRRVPAESTGVVKTVEGEFLFIATVNNNHLDEYEIMGKQLQENVLNDGFVELLWVRKFSKRDPNLPRDAIAFPRITRVKNAVQLSKRKSTTGGGKLTRMHVNRVRTKAYKIELLDDERLPESVRVDGEETHDTRSAIYGQVLKSMVRVMIN